MKKTLFALSLGLGLVAAPLLQACEMHKGDQKVMIQEPAKESKAAKASKKAKSTEKTAQKKGQTSKI